MSFRSQEITLRDARIEARVANAAWTQARLIYESDPTISATDLVERLRQQAIVKAAALDENPASPIVPPGAVGSRSLAPRSDEFEADWPQAESPPPEEGA